jgi:hypothetical protein
VQALVHLESALAAYFEGALTRWSPEAKLLWSYYGNPCDAWAVAVDQVIQLDVPAFLQTKHRSRGSTLTQSSQISLTPALFSPGMNIVPSTKCRRVSGTACGQTCTVGEVLVEWGYSGDNIRMHGVPVLWLPEPITLLLTKGFLRLGHHWPHLVLRASWIGDHLKCKQYIPLPPQNWLDRRQERPHAAMDLDAPPELTTEMCKALAEHVRCNPGQASLPGDEGFEYRATIHQCLWALDGIIEDANDKAMFDQGLTHSRLRRRKMEKVEMLLNILLAVRYSKSRDRKAVAQQASFFMKGLVPASLGGLVAQVQLQPPSSATLSRRQIAIDSAFCLTFRQWLRERQEQSGGDLVLYLFADSSVQGGVDLLLSSYDFCFRRDLVAILRSLGTMLKSSEAYLRSKEGARQDGDGDEDASTTTRARLGLVETMMLTMAKVSSLIHWHDQIPVSVSGSTSVPSKIRGLAHAMWAEAANIPELVSRSQCVVSITSDRGAELGFSSFSGSSLDQFLGPHLIQSVQLEADAAPSVASPLSTAARSAVDNPMVFGRSMEIGGICHGFDNLSKEMDSQFSGWSTFISSLRLAVSFFRRKDLLQRWAHFLLPGTAYSNMKHFIQKALIPKHAEWRWGTVLEVISWLLKRQVLLRSTWDPKRFLGDSPKAQVTLQDNGVQSVMDMTRFTSLMRDDAFWCYTRMVQILHGVIDGLRTWCEGCPCHFGRKLDEQETSEYSQHCKQVEQLHDACKGATDNSCPFKGRRAWQIATGEFHDYAATVMRDAEFDIFQYMAYCRGLFGAPLEKAGER